MKKKRPKLKKLTPNELSRFRKRLRSQIRHVTQDMGELLSKRTIFRDLIEISDSNPNIRNPSTFYDWIISNYVVSSCVLLRRLCDMDNRSISLWRILYLLLEYPGIISRASYRAVSGYSSQADSEFDKMVGKGRKILGPAAIRSDMAKLEKAEARIRRLVNKRLAHHGHPGALRHIPTFRDLDNAIDTVHDLVLRYNSLLTNKGLTSAEIIRVHNWETVLFTPWVLPGTRGSPLSEREKGNQK